MIHVLKKGERVPGEFPTMKAALQAVMAREQKPTMMILELFSRGYDFQLQEKSPCAETQGDKVIEAKL